MVEGRIPSILIEAIKQMLQGYNSRGFVELWGVRLIKSLLSITHKQWLYRNNDVRHVSNGLTAK
jgi:hypothetical protein